MTEGNGHVIDPAGDARRALQDAVAQHGPQVLSDAVMMDSICRDRLPGLPSESILIGSAARSDVPTLLRERVGSLGVDGAIASVAATLSDAYSLDDTACRWVVSEFARVLGYRMPAGTVPMPGPGGFTDQGDALPPSPPGPTAPVAPVPGGPPPGTTQPVWSVPGGPPPGTTQPMASAPGGPQQPGGSSQPLARGFLAVLAALALVGIYLAIAAAAHLSPFPASSHTPQPSGSATGGSSAPNSAGSSAPNTGGSSGGGSGSGSGGSSGGSSGSGSGGSSGSGSGGSSGSGSDPPGSADGSSVPVPAPVPDPKPDPEAGAAALLSSSYATLQVMIVGSQDGRHIASRRCIPSRSQPQAARQV